MISEIEDWAAQITGGGLAGERLVEKWSAFTGRFGEAVSVKGRTWDQVSDGWVIQIHRHGKRDYELWLAKEKTGDLFS